MGNLSAFLLLAILLYGSSGAYAGRWDGVCAVLFRDSRKLRPSETSTSLPMLKETGVFPDLAPIKVDKRVTSVREITGLRRIGAGGDGTAYSANGFVAGDPNPVAVIAKKASSEAVTRREYEAIRKVYPDEVALVRGEDGELFLVRALTPRSSKKPRESAQTAQAIIDAGIIPPIVARRASSSAIQAMESVHSAGLVHLDIKPSNLLVTEEGGVKIIDFGTTVRDGQELPADTALTQYYASPMRTFGEPPHATPHDDIYSLGLSLAELEVPGFFNRDSPWSVARGPGMAPGLAYLPATVRTPKERVLAHYTLAKRSTGDYRDLLDAADDPPSFVKAYSKVWTKAYREMTDPELRRILVHELFLDPNIGPSVIAGIPDAKLRGEIMATAIAAHKRLAAGNRSITYAFNSKMLPTMKQCFQSRPFQRDPELRRMLTQAGVNQP